MRADGLDVSEDVYAPFGDDPLLLHDVTITNRTDAPRSVSWFEYWDVNPYDRGARRDARGVGAPVVGRGDADALACGSRPATAATREPLTHLRRGAATGRSTATRRRSRRSSAPARARRPAAVAADTLTERRSRPPSAGRPRARCSRSARRSRSRPGETVTLRYAYGMAHRRADRAALVAKYRAAADPLAASQRRWADWLPRARLRRRATLGGARARSGTRTSLRSRVGLRGGVRRTTRSRRAATTSTRSGCNLGYAELAALPAADRLHRARARARDPALLDRAPARGRAASSRTASGRCAGASTSARRATSTSGCCSRRPSTGSARATSAFFDEPLPFYDTRRAATRAGSTSSSPTRTRRSLRGPERRLHRGHERRLVGLLDASSLQMTESTARGAPARVRLPAARRAGRPARRPRVRRSGCATRGAELRDVVERASGPGKGWYSRGYGGPNRRSARARSSASRSRGRCSRASRRASRRARWWRTSAASSPASARPAAVDGPARDRLVAQSPAEQRPAT